MGSAEHRAWIRTVAIVWIAELIALMGMSLIMPFLPLYLKDLGVPDREASFWAGWVGGANFLCSALIAPFWGTLADRFGRKPMALRALVGLAVTVLLMGHAQNVYQLLLLRLMQGAFGGFVAAAIALVGAAVPRERLGSALGFLQTAVVGGNLVGPLLGGELSHRFGYRSTFQITGAALLVAAFLILVFVRERHTAPEPDERRGVAQNVQELIRVPALRWMLVVVVCSHAGMMLINPQISLFLRHLVRRPEELNRAVGLVIAAPALASFLMAPLWGREGDRRGPARVLGFALCGAGLTIPGAALAQHVWQIFLVRLVMGGFISALSPSTHAAVARCVPQNRTAGAFSLLSSAQMLGSCLGPFASGPIAATFGVRCLFPLTGLLLLLGSAAAVRAHAEAGVSPATKNQ